MGFQTVLTHRARVLQKVKAGARVEGTAVYGTVEGSWLRCRLFPDETSETDGYRGGRRVLMKTPHVIVGVKDVNGDPIAPGDISPSVRLEIDLGQLGKQVWQVSSDPQPLLTRTKLLGFYFGVRRVETAGAEAGGF